MAKSLYIGINNLARKIKKIYVGIDNKARKVKKAYVGINGIARCFFNGESFSVEYIKTLSLISRCKGAAAASTDNHVLFAGGLSTSSTPVSTVSAIDSSLTCSSATELAEAEYKLAGVSLSDYGYALFAGGRSTNSYWTNTVYRYNSSLTNFSTKITYSSYCTYGPSATHANSYAIFAGGHRSQDGTAQNFVLTDIVLAVNNASEISSPECISLARHNMAAATVEDYYAIFAGGGLASDDNGVTNVDVYDGSLTKIAVTELSEGKYSVAGTHVGKNGKYALFAGGNSGGAGGVYSGEPYDTVEIYDSDLTKTFAESLSTARWSIGATTVNGVAVFAGGITSDRKYCDIVEVYDDSLTKTIAPSLPSETQASGYGFSAAAIEDYAIFGGGVTEDASYSKAAYAYKVVNER